MSVSPWGHPFAIIFPLMIAFMVGIINYIIGIEKDLRNNSTILPVVVDPKFTNIDRPASPLQSEICKFTNLDQPSPLQSGIIYHI